MPDILHRVGIDAKPEKVFETLTTLEGNRRWWDSNATGDAQKGGVLTFFNHDFKVTETKPNKLVKWKCVRGSKEWLNTEIIFDLAWKQDQTFVLFAHAGWKEPIELMHHCCTKWAVFLLSLKDYVEKGKGHPAPDDIQVYVGG